MHNPFACHSKNEMMSHILFPLDLLAIEEVNKIGWNVVEDKVEDNAQLRVICVEEIRENWVLGVEWNFSNLMHFYAHLPSCITVS